MTWAVGVDVGGPCTDAVAIGADGRCLAAKVPTTPHDQSAGVLAAIEALGIRAEGIDRVAHGTTVVTNLLLERSGARVVLCATAGATDLLRLRRQDRAALYDLAADHAPPLVAADAVVGVTERVGARGVATPLADDVVAAVVASVRGQHPEIVAVALLFAHEAPAHEQRLAAALRAALRAALPAGVDVVCSHEVLPEIREFERTATTAAEAYARPRVARYLAALEARLAARGLPAPLVVTSSGGMLPAGVAARHAAALALSGPAGGVVGAAAVCRAARVPLALTVDIGGTSADVGVVVDGAPLVEAGGDVAGVPIALPRVLVETVSAGGGSIAWADDGGALRVGPRSAGARPGPACYGLGGTEPTVTDAHVVLGTVQARSLAGGVALDAARAHEAVGRLAAVLGAEPTRVARAIIASADAAMARALRRVSVERGLDPRTATLVPFGGGGPLHACGLAEHLGMHEILVPPFAGVLSALGLAMAPERRDGLASVLAGAEGLDAAAVGAACAAADTATDGVHLPDVAFTARVRYAGQGHEVETPVAPGDDGPAIAARFAASHRTRFGFALERPVELVSLRATRSGAAHAIALSRTGDGASAWDDAAPRDDGGTLARTVRGPVSVALPDATLHVALGWTATALGIGGWHLTREG
ncbi:MAG: hydantoinase/oxoprolinase family protein [Gemmatimonadota bacterium]